MSFFSVDGRFLLAAAILHALVLWAGNFEGQRAQYGMAAATGSASVTPPSTTRAAQASDDLTLDLSDQAWAARAVKHQRQAPPPQVAQPIGTGVTKESPGYLLNPHPPYPEEARQLRQAGQVLLRVKVDDQGVVESVELAKSSGYPLLDESALQTVEHQWKFQPARLAGVAVTSTVDVPIVFSLTD
jgi:TonB family protein